jgi:anti-sigma B factor antagonist
MRGIKCLMRDLQVQITAEGRVCRVVLTGELDLATRLAFTEALAEPLASEAHEIRIDVHELTFCDSTGLGAIIRARKAAIAVGKRFMLDRPSAHMTTLLTITDLVNVLTDDHRHLRNRG